MNADSLKNLLEYTMKRYESTLQSMLDIGDVNVDDVNILCKETHQQLMELITTLQHGTKEKQM